jgi:hypothetical protein
MSSHWAAPAQCLQISHPAIRGGAAGHQRLAMPPPFHPYIARHSLPHWRGPAGKKRAGRQPGSRPCHATTPAPDPERVEPRRSANRGSSHVLRCCFLVVSALILRARHTVVALTRASSGLPVAGSDAVCRFRLNSRSGIDEGSDIFHLHSRSEMSGAIAGLTRSDASERDHGTQYIARVTAVPNAERIRQPNEAGACSSASSKLRRVSSVEQRKPSCADHNEIFEWQNVRGRLWVNVRKPAAATALPV